MADSIDDLLGLDRDVRRAAAAYARWRAEIVTLPEEGLLEDPFDGLRHTSTKSTWDALGRQAPSTVDAPLRDALRRWVGALLQSRVLMRDDLALAKESHVGRGRFEGSPQKKVSWRDAWRGFLASKRVAESRLWLEAAGDSGPALADAIRTRASRRVEVARRMGFLHPWEMLVPFDRSVLREAARRLLDATEDLSRAVWRDALRDERHDAAATLHAALSRDASEGWPARLTPRWLEETFGAARGDLPIDLPALPQTVGASSFARALSTFGHSVRLATAPHGFPFALARDPAFVAAHRFGFVFGSLAAEPEFHVRALGLVRRSAISQARILARSALLDARLHAARILLGDDVGIASRDAFEEIGTRLFGAPLDIRWCGAWPAAREDEPARLLGLLGARALRNDLRDRFDVDWFRNPRAWVAMRTEGTQPAFEPSDHRTPVAEADALARAFEEALG